MAVGDDDGLEDVPVGLEVRAQPLAPRLPGEAPHEDLGVRGVPVRPAQVVQRRRPAPSPSSSSSSSSQHHRRRPLRRHHPARMRPRTLTLAAQPLTAETRHEEERRTSIKQRGEGEPLARLLAGRAIIAVGLVLIREAVSKIRRERGRGGGASEWEVGAGGTKEEEGGYLAPRGRGQQGQRGQRVVWAFVDGDGMGLLAHTHTHIMLTFYTTRGLKTSLCHTRTNSMDKQETSRQFPGSNRVFPFFLATESRFS